MDHNGDPKQKLIDALGDLSKIELFNNKILVAVYIRPEKTKSGLYLSDAYRDEDRFQGKVGLLVATGPDAFADESGTWFRGTDFKMHDWLVFRPSDGWSITVNGVLCRVLSDTNVQMRIPSPDAAW